MAQLDKKKGFGIVALTVAIVIIVLVMWLVRLPKNNNVLLQDGVILPETKCQEINKVTMIHSTGCPHCAVALPRLQELEQELNMTFTYYDLAVDEDKEKVLLLGLIPESVPTTIINCKVYVGVRSKEEYQEAILA